jgi:hypothetical protein
MREVSVSPSSIDQIALLSALGIEGVSEQEPPAITPIAHTSLARLGTSCDRALERSGRSAARGGCVAEVSSGERAQEQTSRIAQAAKRSVYTGGLCSRVRAADPKSMRRHVWSCRECAVSVTTRRRSSASTVSDLADASGLANQSSHPLLPRSSPEKGFVFFACLQLDISSFALPPRQYSADERLYQRTEIRDTE